MKILNLENENRKFTKSIENFHVMEYLQDSSVSPMTAMEEYYMSKMNVRRRQVVIETGQGALRDYPVRCDAVDGRPCTGDRRNQRDRRPVRKGHQRRHDKGICRKTGVRWRRISRAGTDLQIHHLVDVEKWGSSGMTIEDGIFLACDGRVKNKLTARKSISSAVLGGEGFFNLSLVGRGAVALESNVPEDELIEVELENDELKIDGNLAVCWSSNLDFTVERSTKTLVGSAVSGEGLVNVYRGTGRVLMSPVAPTDSLLTATNTTQANPAVKNQPSAGKLNSNPLRPYA